MRAFRWEVPAFSAVICTLSIPWVGTEWRNGTLPQNSWLLSSVIQPLQLSLKGWKSQNPTPPCKIPGPSRGEARGSPAFLAMLTWSRASVKMIYLLSENGGVGRGSNAKALTVPTMFE
jgi:hypothetical protein